MKYYFKSSDELLGPFTAEEIRQGIAEQRYQESDAVRSEERVPWTRLGSLQEFTEAFGSQSPKRNSMATTSLIMGIGSPLVLALALVWESIFLLLSHLLLALGSIFYGHWAIARIKGSLCEVKGLGMARNGLILGYFMVALAVLQTDINPASGRISERGAQVQAINNCKQIIIAMRLYSSDSRDIYPDFDASNAHSSNDVFRLLFKEGILETEKIFGAARSPYHPDGNIGEAPDFLEAVKPGENHWAMTKGLTGSMDGGIPLVFENPSDANWPPKWNADATWPSKWQTYFKTPKPGRTWSKGKVIIGFNDTSVEVLPLEATKGESVGLKPHPDGKPIFPVLDPKLEILNVAK